MNQGRTLAGEVEAARSVLAAAGVPSPQTDAVALAAFALSTDPGEVRARMILRVPADEAFTERYAGLVADRATRVPLQHLTGTAHFRRLALTVGPGVFLPRPETEVVAGLAIQAAEDAGASPRVVDLCTGSGALAFAVKDEVPGAEVLAVEISDLAHAWAVANRDRLGLDVDIRLGDAAEAFPELEGAVDVVVSNPPFVITPRSGVVPLFEYRDGGAAGDAVVRDLVRSVGAHLEPGGIAQFLGNWEVGVGEAWVDRVGAWLGGTGLDAWVVQREVQDPAEYAETWARDGGHHPGTADFNTMYAAWLDDFEARDVGSIGFGVITLQRPGTDREPFLDLMDVPWPVESPMGPSVLAGLDARTWLAGASDSDVLRETWRCAADVHEERHTMPGASDPSAIILRQGGGLRRHLSLSTVTAAFVSVCDGDLSAGTAAAAIAGVLDLPGESVSAEVVTFVRDAAKDGLLVR